jgi:ubiquinone/menaquinone biosynthesis C-methylase UbiE
LSSKKRAWDRGGTHTLPFEVPIHRENGIFLTLSARRYIIEGVNQKKVNMEEIERSLICPECSHSLKKREDGFICNTCDHIYPLVKGIPFLVRSDNTHKKEEAAYHTSISHKYFQIHHLGSPRNTYFHRKSLHPLIEDAKGGVILELGCGTGSDALFLLQNNLRVVETDISPGQVRTAKERLSLPEYRDRTLFYISDAENIPFPDELFDATFITASLHHLEKPERAMREMVRCTKKEGTIIVAMEPNRYEWIRILNYPFSLIKNMGYFLLGKQRFSKILKRADDMREPTVERTFSKRELTTLVKESGLRLIRIHSIWFTCGLVHWGITLLNKLSQHQWYINRDVERFLVLIDEFLSHIPLINNYACNWSVECKK